jgi:hypothetical protein
LDMVDKTLQGLMASLHITDCISSHAFKPRRGGLTPRDLRIPARLL